MTNLSLQFRFSALLWSFSFGTLVIILTSFVLHGVDIFMLGFLAVGIAVSAWGQWLSRAWLAPIAKLKLAVDEVAQGKFNSRVTGIAESHDEISMLCWSVNDMLDQLSVMFREQESSFRANLKGDFYRTAISGGMHGELRKNLDNLNVLLKEMEKQKIGAMRTQMLSRAHSLNTDNLLKT